MRRVLIALIALLLCVPLLMLSGTSARAVAQDDPECQTFPEPGKQVCGVFLQYWREHGGLAQQGVPLTGEMTATGGGDPKARKRQFFERAVFEYHEEFAGT